MTTGIHPCSCGSRFGLRVELAVHCESTGHAPLRLAVPAPAPVVMDELVVAEPVAEAPAPRRRRLRIPARVARPLVAAALVLSFLGFNVLMQKTVQTCTALQTTLATQVVCP